MASGRRTFNRVPEATMRTRLSAGGVFLLAALLLLPASATAQEKENPVLTFVKSRVKNTDKPFTLVILLQVKKGSGAKLEAAFAKASRPTHKEKGCLAYDLNRDTEKPERYVVYERWQNLKALEAHLNTAHIKKLLADLPELLAGMPEPRVLIPAGE
jgi:quinol monooxygenase YgiN